MDLFTDLGLTPFEVAIGAVVAAVILGVWLINRRRGHDKSKLEIPTEVIAIAVTITGLIIVLVIRSGIVTNEPLLSLVALILLLTAVASFIDAYITYNVRKEIRLIGERFGAQMAGLGNLQFFPSKEETFKALTTQTYQAREKLIATRFSPADISMESEYWAAIRKRALDPSVLYIRIHCLVVCKLSFATN